MADCFANTAMFASASYLTGVYLTVECFTTHRPGSKTAEKSKPAAASFRIIRICVLTFSRPSYEKTDAPQLDALQVTVSNIKTRDVMSLHKGAFVSESSFSQKTSTSDYQHYC